MPANFSSSPLRRQSCFHYKPSTSDARFLSYPDLTEKEIRPGDKFLAVNGRPVDPNQNRHRYFYFANIPEELVLEFSRDGDVFEVVTRPLSHHQISTLLYDDWIEENPDMCRKKATDGWLMYT